MLFSPSIIILKPGEFATALHFFSPLNGSYYAVNSSLFSFPKEGPQPLWQYIPPLPVLVN
jgi:hypothetical protein